MLSNNLRNNLNLLDYIIKQDCLCNNNFILFITLVSQNVGNSRTINQAVAHVLGLGFLPLLVYEKHRKLNYSIEIIIGNTCAKNIFDLPKLKNRGHWS